MTLRGYKIDILVQLYSLISSLYYHSAVHTQVMSQSGLPSLGDFNVFIIGSSGMGKTTFIQKHATGDFISAYTPTTETQITPISLRVVGEGVDGIVKLRVCDHFSGEWWNEVDAAIFMFDLGKPSTVLTSMSALKHFRTLHLDVPIVFVGNKHDLFNIVYLTPMHQLMATLDVFFIMVSSKTNFDYEKPFLHLIRKLMENVALEFEEIPVVAPPTVVIPPHLMKAALQELEAAGVTHLPDLPDIEENQWSDSTVSMPELEFGS